MGEPVQEKVVDHEQLRTLSENERNVTTLRKCADFLITAGADFAHHASIHGVRYAFEPSRHFVERLIWIASVAVCTAAASAMVYSSLWKFYEEPTIMSFDSLYYRTYNIPFPAVTICNVNIVFRSKARKLAKTLRSTGGLSVQRIEVLLSRIDLLLHPNLEIDPAIIGELADLQDILDNNNITIRHLVKSLSQPCSEMVERCSWDGELKSCEEIFHDSATYNGYCCSFNKDVVTNWTHHPDKDPFRLRSAQHGTGGGLHVLLNPMSHDYLWGAFVSSGFSVMIHRGGLNPEAASIFVSPNSEKLIAVYPSITEGQKDLYDVLPARRNCTFYNERPLSSARLYSRDACVSECRATVVQSLCDCVPFYFLEQVISTRKRRGRHSGPPVHTEFRACSLRDIPCLKKHARIFQADESVTECECHPRCIVAYYKVSPATGDFNAVQYHVGDLYKGMNTSSRASVNVFIASHVTTQSRKNMIYTTTELMSKLGGTFSLLLGCSFLTGMELLQFSIVRTMFFISRLFRK